jgi:predicted molibdopterin-dependent oxidoreductase YjgC
LCACSESVLRSHATANEPGNSHDTTNMCEMIIRMCPECSVEFNSRFELCDFGKSGRVCVNPTTNTSRPYLSISTNTMDGVERADMVFIVGTKVDDSPCLDCSGLSDAETTT